MSELKREDKDAISESLRAYVAKYPSQTKAAGSLKNTSVGTVSNILNGRYENISDEMFRNIASQVGSVNPTGWQIVETGAYQEITGVLADAQRWRNVTWVTGGSRLRQEYRRPQLSSGTQGSFLYPLFRGHEER